MAAQPDGCRISCSACLELVPSFQDVVVQLMLQKAYLSELLLGERLICAALGENFCIQETPDRRKCNVDFRKITPLDTKGMNVTYEEALPSP